MSLPSIEPRRKTCRLGHPNCGRCANCAADAWAAVWRSLHDEDRDWVREQLARCLTWAGVTPPSRGTWAWSFLGSPSPTRWVLR